MSARPWLQEFNILFTKSGVRAGSTSLNVCATGHTVRIPRAPDDRPGYVIGVGLDQAAWAVQGMLPEPRVVEERMMDYRDRHRDVSNEAIGAALRRLAQDDPEEESEVTAADDT
jgi:hypothetical protein